eukprot:5846236-Prymnesium_polylepis.1
MPLRTIVPLDWDHVWSEAADDHGGWRPPRDAPARNFAGRLDEGIGAWTAVLAVSASPDGCACVTDEYLRCAGDDGGRTDAELAPQMARYRQRVAEALADASGERCQARTLNGHVLERAGFSATHVTAVLRRAVRDHGRREWWEVGTEDVALG